MYKKTFLSAALAASALMMGMLPTAADAQLSIILQTAPPAPIYEVVPAPRPGYIWAPGHHQWHNNQYVWTTGQWYRERPGYDFRGAQWVERNGRWTMVGNDWRQRGPNGDRDGDGITNRYDNDNNGNHRRNRGRNGPHGDMDRDGVPNNRDRAPNNPNRS